MNIYLKKIKKILTFSIFFLISSCQSYSTDYNSQEKINVGSLSEIKKGEACSNNLFGGFTIPYIGETAIKLSGDQSVITAIKSGNIQNVYAVDKYNKNYFFYSKRCTVVYGK
jgi:hypothetical protein